MRNRFKQYHEPVAELLRKNLRFSVKGIAEELEVRIFYVDMILREMEQAGYPIEIHSERVVFWREGKVRTAKLPKHKFNEFAPV